MIVNRIEGGTDDTSVSCSGNGLFLDQHPAIIRTIDDFLSIGNKHQRNLNENSTIFIDENDFVHFVCKVADILSRLQCDNRNCEVQISFEIACFVCFNWLSSYQLW